MAFNNNIEPADFDFGDLDLLLDLQDEDARDASIAAVETDVLAGNAAEFDISWLESLPELTSPLQSPAAFAPPSAPLAAAAPPAVVAQAPPTLVAPVPPPLVIPYYEQAAASSPMRLASPVTYFPASGQSPLPQTPAPTPAPQPLLKGYVPLPQRAAVAPADLLATRATQLIEEVQKINSTLLSGVSVSGLQVGPPNSARWPARRTWKANKIRDAARRCPP